MQSVTPVQTLQVPSLWQSVTIAQNALGHVPTLLDFYVPWVSKAVDG